MQLKFTTPVPPSVNSYLGKRVQYIAGKAIVQEYTTKEARDYKNHVKKIILREMNKQMKDNNNTFLVDNKNRYFFVDCIFYMDKKRKDADNHFKCLLDAIVESGILPDDDIILPRAKNLYIDKENPRVEVTISLAKKVGIFEDENEAESFVTNNCIDCSRYSRNCSILNKAYENRIQPEINLEQFICLKKKLKKKK